MTLQTSTPVSPRTSNPDNLDPLPPYLRRTEPMEPEDLPLQLALLTMEVAAMYKVLGRLADLLETMATAVRPPVFPDD